MIFGVGTDIIEISRVEKAVAGAAFYEKTFTPAERDYLAGKRPQSAAGLFAAKEAVAKALGTGFYGFRPADVEILHDKSGKPDVKLYNRAAKIADENSVVKIHVSISHCVAYAVAYAVAERES
ncbi:MAG: holo-ACP synthase [Defluviitaleaceae bacterium]|nr:holo-ACP synthase [Defluviitaleaceae bacterium]